MTIFQSRFRLAALLLATPLIFSSCKDKKDPEPADDNEQITTVTYLLTPAAGSTAPTATVTWRDTDGTGGNAPTIGTLNLKPNTTYTGALTLLDETKNPVVVTSDEIRKELDDHLFFFDTTPASLLGITRTDKDSKNLEVGLATRVVTTAAGTGNLKITLRHQPGTKNGTFAPGDTDIEVTFPVTVQ
ncbi:hypothetical protein [Hymenobacter antarcticus]|uniref:Type 1 periplasmic binding fold superfamily protein n=1 Tax=Hymenobacter antarcticus TaxID=486270 RepID=A0ABP7QKN9_9BACT